MKKMSPYEEAHLLVAAIRVLEFQNKKSPGYGEIAGLLGINIEKVGLLCKRMEAEGIVQLVAGPFETTHLIIADHCGIEELPREAAENRMAEEIREFKEKSKNAFEEKVKAAAEEKRKKEKELFAELERKLKGGGA